MTANALKLADYDRDETVVQATPRNPGSAAKIKSPRRRAEVADAVDWALWIEAREAAGILGLHADHFMRTVRSSLAKNGMAMRSKGPEASGQARWWVKRDYDLRLCDSPIGNASRVPKAFLELTEKQRNQAMARAACVKRYRAMLTCKSSGPVKRWIDGLVESLSIDYKGMKISARSLARWHSLYNSEADLMKLADRRGGARNGEIDPAAWQFFKDLFLQDNQLSRRYCHQLTCDKADAEGWSWHPRGAAGYSKTVRRVRKEIPYVTRIKARYPDRYRNSMSPHMVMDPDAFEPGERWQGDHCVLDLFCLFPGSGGGRVGRPWLTAWMDTKSRKIVGWQLCESPSSETIRAAFAQAMRDPSNMGGPAIVHIDNGKDYKCEAFTGGKFTSRKKLLKKGYADTPEFKGLYGLLGIETIFAIPKNSRGKGAIESWFGYSLHERHDKLWRDVYAGRNHDNRPRDLMKRLKDKRSLPTFEDIRRSVALHIDQYNADAEHGKEDIMDRSPNAVMLDARQRVFADAGVLEFMELTFSSPRRVHRHAVSLPHQGKTLRYTSTDSGFVALSNTARMVRIGYRQEDLLGQVYLFDAETMQLICSATNERAGSSIQTETGRQDVKAAMAKQRRVEKAHQVLREEGPASYTPVELLAQREAAVRKQAESEAGQDQQPQTNTRLIQTPLDGQSKALQRAIMRRAAGAENAPGVAQAAGVMISTDLTRRLVSRTSKTATPARTGFVGVTNINKPATDGQNGGKP